MYSSQLFHPFLHILMDLAFSDSTQTYVLWKHGDVLHVVEIAEHADLPEFRNTCEHRELDMSVHGLEYSVERLEYASEFLLQRFVPDSLEQRLVVFVHEDGYAVAGLFVSPLYYSCKA